MAAIEPTPIDKREKVVADLDDGLELRADGVIRKTGVAVAAARVTDVPPRTDLPKDHPLYGERVLRVGMSGWPDMTIGADGRPTPAVEVEPKPEPAVTEVIDVTRR